MLARCLRALYCFIAFFVLQNLSYATGQRVLVDEFEGGKLYQVDGVSVVVLRGNYLQMGRQYGHLLRQQLAAANKQIGHIFGGVQYKLLTEYATVFRYRNTPEIKAIINGMAQTSQLGQSTSESKKKLVLLDQALPFSAVAKNVKQGCTVMAAWGQYTDSTNTIIGRNFDWSKKYFPYFKPYPVIAIYNPDDGRPSVTTVGYVGWISSITGINSKGLSLMLNSGAYSTGKGVDPLKPSYFAKLTQSLFESKTLKQLEQSLSNTKPETGYIVTIADKQQSLVIETSPTLILKLKHRKQFARSRRDNSMSHYPNLLGLGRLVATNSFRLAGWDDNFILTKLFNITPYPVEGSTPSLSFLRYGNIRDFLLKAKTPLTAKDFRKALNKPIELGGVTEYDDNPLFQYENTYYSVVYDASRNQLSVRYINDENSSWITLSLSKYYA